MASTVRLCKFFLRGTCRFGNGYRYSHDVLIQERGEEAEKATASAGELLVTIQPTEQESQDGNVQITDYEFLASYNWKDVDEPTIVVPGKSA